MTLHELDSANAVHSFKSNNANCVICFSATWCGPCTSSKPQLEALANYYEQDPTVDVKFAIAYEHNLAESIHEFQIRAFPTYVLFVENGRREHGRVKGVNFEGIRGMISEAGCKADLGEGNTLGGGMTSALSAAEARAQRLAMFDKKTAAEPMDTGAAPAPATVTAAKEEQTEMEEAGEDTSPMKTDANTTDTEMKTDAAEAKPSDEKDVEMENVQCKEIEMVDPTESLRPEEIHTLVDCMGFKLIRAQKALLNSTSISGAIEWLSKHQDDPDIDDPIEKVPKKSAAEAVAKSYKCNECGKVLSNMANLELHANKTGHSDFSESTESVKPLTEEEKAKKIEEIKSLLKAKRIERELAEKAALVDKEKERRNMGKNMTKTREEMEIQKRRRDAALRKKEKEEFKKERARIKAEIEKDRRERKAQNGKLSSKLGIEGYNPDAIQYDLEAEKTEGTDEKPAKKTKASASKIDDYISKISSYKAGGDGGKCLKILLAYIRNIVDKPGEDKYKKINTDNKVYKTKVKPFVGAKALLLAVGFSANEDNSALVLGDDADMDILAQTKTKLEAAHAAY